MSQPEALAGNGGYQFKVEYNESPWPSRYGYTGVCRRGAHMFTDRDSARKFMEVHFLREPRLREWRDGRWK